MAKIRQIAFNVSGTKMYGIGLTSPRIYLIDLSSEKKEVEFEAKSLFMSLSVDKASGRVVATNNDYIYILSEALAVQKSFASPSNNGNFVLESQIFEPWVVTMGDNFNAENLSSLFVGNKDSKTNSQKHSVSWPGSGAFTIQGDIMISGKS